MPPKNQQSTELPPSLAAALLPFAIAEELGIPCAYERSIKISPAGILPNRFLLSIDTRLLSLDQAKSACVRLGLPPLQITKFSKRYHRAAQFMMGYEEGQQDSVLKVYLEMRGLRRPAVLSHIGWKWTVASTEVSQPRLTLYRRVKCPNTNSRLKFLQRCVGAADSAPLRLAGDVLEREEASRVELTCLAIIESGQCRGADLNLYPMGLAVQSLSEPLAAMMAQFGLSQALLDTVLSLSGTKQLGHLSIGAEYLTIYYLPE